MAYDAEVLRRELAAHPELLGEFPELVRAHPELVSGSDRESGTEPDAEEVPLGASRQVQEYNDMLAAYAARGRAKSWRNPRGR